MVHTLDANGQSASAIAHYNKYKHINGTHVGTNIGDVSLDIGDDFVIRFEDGLVDKIGAYATYGNKIPKNANHFGYNKLLDNGKMRITLDSSLLKSDEGLLSVLSHEIFEINYLKKSFMEQGTMSGNTFFDLISPRAGGNRGVKIGGRYMNRWVPGGSVHNQAWEVGDALILKYRELMGL